MEEVTIQPNCIPQPSLSTAYDIGKQIEAKQAEIDKLREDSGITKLEAEIHALDEAYAAIIKNCIANNTFEDGPLRLVAKGGPRRKIIPEAFHRAYPQMFFELANIPVTASENSLSEYYETACGMSKKEAKMKAKETITSLCEMVGKPRYELINLTE
ncbi:MAG: hypothetical protein M0R51_12680 [Clostridia bacterium]|jgi:hypothetical protein|nr:hypothetical protein [Clostridia bacterium]